MIAVEIHPAAQNEFHDAISYYSQHDEEIARDFADAYDEKRQRIRVNPGAYHLRGKVIRRANFGKQFKEWYLAFMLLDNKVVILAVAHAKRRPFYFKDRVEEARLIF